MIFTNKTQIATHTSLPDWVCPS